MKPKYKTLNSTSSNEFNAQRQDWNIARWCHEQGIDLKTIETHPCVSDIRKLLDFDALDHLMSDKDRKIWASVWKVVYKLRLPISVYNGERLLSIVEHCNRVEHILKRQQKKAAGLKTSEIGDHNDEAKGSQSATNLIYGLGQQDDGSARIRAKQVIEVR
jgi:hypothetical protein